MILPHLIVYSGGYVGLEIARPIAVTRSACKIIECGPQSKQVSTEPASLVAVSHRCASALAGI